MALVTSASSKVYSGFDPRTIPNCTLWLDAADASALTLSGSSVTQWRDKSGQGYNATGGVSPTYSNNGVVFNGTNMYLSTNYSAVPTNETVLIVATWAGGPDRNYCLIGTSVTNGRNYNVGASPPFVKWDIWGVAGYAPTTGVVSNVRFLTTGVYGGGSGTTGLNGGTQSSPASFSASGTGKTNIGAGVLGDYYNGTINEIIIYSSALTQSQYKQIEGYLAAKWALQANLPATHLYRSIPIVTRPFQPIEISNCVLWLDAADASTLTLSGSNVTQWNDKSGNGRNATQGTSARQPTYLSGTAVAFNKANSNVLALPDDTIPSGNSAYSVFVAITPRTDGADGSDVFLYSGNLSNNQTNGFFYFSYLGSNQFQNYWYSVDSTGGAWTKGTRTLIEFIYTQNVNRYIYQNGALQTTTPSSNRTSGTGNNLIGAQASSLFYSTCDIHEIIIYNVDVTAIQRQQIESYLATKWGLRTNLPSTHPFKLVPAITPAFTPLQISGCALWLDAADASTLTLSGSNVTQWNDKSGNGNTPTQSTGSNQPTYVSSSNALSFNGTSSFMYTPLVSQLTVATGFTIFVVATQSSQNGAYQRLLSTNEDLYPNALLWGGYSGNITIDLGNTAAWGNSASVISPTVSALQKSIVAATFSTGGIAPYVNGTTYTLRSSSSNHPIPNLYIGSAYYYSAARQFWPGTVNEILVFSQSLTATQRQQIEGYLAAKWGLKGNLPTTHPFKVITP